METEAEMEMEMQMEMEMERDEGRRKRERGQMEAEEVGRKREHQIKTRGPGRKKAAEPALDPESLGVLRRMRSLCKQTEELSLKRAVARRNKENPDAEPIVLEELTEQERKALVQEERKKAKEYSKQRCEEMLIAHEERLRAPPPPPPQEDQSEGTYRRFRQHWEGKYAQVYGSFEATTPIPSMCFTDNPVPFHTRHAYTLQIFAVKVAGIDAGLQWPLDVFGTIAFRDGLDHNRNIIFSRARDNCQTLMEQDPYLVLTGPTRAVVYGSSGTVYLDAVLKVKGVTKSEDKDLSLLFVRHKCCESPNSCVSRKYYTSKLSTLEVASGIVISSVEATITIRVVKGSWPDGFCGKFTACTASVAHMKVLLLNSGDEKVPVASTDGTVELSRCVVSVERSGELIVSAVVSRGCDQVAEAVASFTPLEAGRSHDMLDVGFCKMEVTVAWSLFLYGYPNSLFSPTKRSGEAVASSSSSQVV